MRRALLITGVGWSENAKVPEIMRSAQVFSVPLRMRMRKITDRNRIKNGS
jgi:hypothetical protein